MDQIPQQSAAERAEQDLLCAENHATMARMFGRPDPRDELAIEIARITLQLARAEQA